MYWLFFYYMLLMVVWQAPLACYYHALPRQGAVSRTRDLEACCAGPRIGASVVIL